MALKINLSKSLEISDGVTQTSFTLRDIHCEGDMLIVHTHQGNIVPVLASAYEVFLNTLCQNVKAILETPKNDSDSEKK